MFGTIWQDVCTQLQDGIVATIVEWVTSLLGSFFAGAA